MGQLAMLVGRRGVSNLTHRRVQTRGNVAIFADFQIARFADAGIKGRGQYRLISSKANGVANPAEANGDETTMQ